MKIQPHHIDLTESTDEVYTSFKDRSAIQLEMIKDHAWLNGLSIDEACDSWVANGWAILFAKHYFLK